MYFHLMVQPRSRLVLTILMVLVTVALFIWLRTFAWLPMLLYMLLMFRWIKNEEQEKAKSAQSE